ncbi:putative 2-dehydropantoate 2-reductase [Leptolyngbya cf. ectocarpi LEGE 11479]|uniref:2-dehydropantoate 2-reductase n=1 Tax=Leptolyngbya cf. ectocarpi LEGE 11479 TaxID=1828722 RepID=A0A928X5B0_LEPEC|nr:putative 2-dehydropantoate 2-reductase [Leptolyngbya ectocarpi]MBE9067103.1 putative 2-dehydropantoate 2-reductase [Leptolyngbya cf. ectocarpi LEGE 11479]
MSAKRYAIIGTGAIGGYYGARLQQSGCDVHFLLRSDYDYVNKNGLVVESVDGDIKLSQVNAYNNPAAMPPMDVVVIALKTIQNHDLKRLLPPLNDDAVVLLLQNGLDIEAEIAQLVSPENIMGGLCFVCSNKVGPGHIRHLDYGKIQLGAYSATNQPRSLTAVMMEIAADLRAANIPIDVTEDLFMARWRKLVWNVPYNGLSVVLDATTEELMADSEVKAQISTLMTEVITTANAWADHLSKDNGSMRQIPLTWVTSMLDATTRMKPYRTSMKIDFDEGRPLEVEAILGKPVRAAAKLGVAVPEMEKLYGQVKALSKSS